MDRMPILTTAIPRALQRVGIAATLLAGMSLAALAQSTGSGATAGQSNAQPTTPRAATGQQSQGQPQAAPESRNNQRRQTAPDGPGCRYRQNELQMLV